MTNLDIPRSWRVLIAALERGNRVERFAAWLARKATA